jgi:succinyl-CoA synthetase beta subunit
MKILSQDIVHKTEYGCVKLDLEDDREVSVAYETIMAQARHHFPRARIEGVTITEMVTEATEMILGFSVDRSFGPVVMFGMGGIYVEVLKDVSFRVAPVPRQECESMVKGINSYPILAGARGKAIRDIPKIVEAISRISYLASRVPDILELDINPLMVLAKGKGCKVVDSRMTIRKVSENKEEKA